MRRPNLLVVGAAKSGTSYLVNLLAQHPMVSIPKTRDNKPRKFLEKYCFEDRGNLTEYLESFGSHEQLILGEKNNRYLFNKWVPEAIQEHFGTDIFLIFLLRNPIDRAYSHYWESIRFSREWLSFEKAIALEKERLNSTDYNHKCRYSYVARGKYKDQIQRYLALFPEEKMIFIISEDFFQNPKTTLMNICSFLGVNTDFKFNLKAEKIHGSNNGYAGLPKFLKLYLLLNNLKKNTNLGLWRLSGLLRRWPRSDKAQYPEMKPSTRAMLRRKFNEDINWLSEFLGKEINYWK